MKAKLIRDCKVPPGVEDDRIQTRDDGRRYWPEGTVIDDPRAYRLVEMGQAEPADDECRVRVCLSSEEMKTKQRHQEMVAKGISPHDYQRYLDGEILGYDENGDDIPGPNYIERDDDDDD